MRNFYLYVLFCLGFVTQAFAGDGHSASGRLRVNAQIQGSIRVTFTADAIEPITASGARAAYFTVPVFGGSFSPDSTPVASGDSTFLIYSPFAIEVTAANLASASYTLNARLATADSSHSWTIDGAEISSGRQQTISTHDFYNVPNGHALVVSGPAVLPLITNQIGFQVTAN